SHPFIAPNVPNPSEIRIFALPSGKLVKTKDVHSGPKNRLELAFSPDGKLLFSLGGNGVLRVEDIVSGKEVLQRKLPIDYANLAVSADGKFLAISSAVYTSKLFLWQWQGKEPRELKVPEYGAYWISFSPDGKLLATIGSPQMQGVRVWEVPSGRLL